MAPVTQTVETSSLRRLLALDKDFSRFDEQLEQIENVLGEPQENTNVDGLGDNPILYYRATPRAEWILRWLLTKLKSDEPVGLKARGNADTWALLKRIVLGLPSSVSARLLNANKYLDILERTLRENFAEESDIGSQHKEHRTGDPSERDEIHGQEVKLVTRTKEPRPSRKRKREGTPAEESSSSSRPALLQKRLSLFNLVAAAATELSIDSPDDHAKPVAEHRKSVWRTDTAQAARLLRLWLESIHYLFIRQPNEAVGVTLESLLPKILQIWNMSVADLGSDSSSSAQHFSRECLVPAIVILSEVPKEYMASLGQSRVERGGRVENEVCRTLETLLARHIFIPGRATFFAESDGRPVSKAGSIQPEVRKLSDLLTPLRSAIEGMGSHENGPGPMDSDRSRFFELTGSLLDIAIRCSQRSTPKKRLDEAPWLQHVFVVLCDCLGAPVRGNSSQHVDAHCKTVLNQMLDIVHNRKVSLEADVLDTIVRSYSGIVGPQAGSEPFNQQLIARIIAYDSSVFLDSPSNMTDGDDVSVSGYLFAAITNFSNENPGPYPSGVEGKDSHMTAIYNHLKTSIVVPLMKAYAQARDLTGFLSRWFIQLKRLSTSASYSMDKSVWVERDIVLALSEVLETSLTSRQVSDLLNEHEHRISACQEPPKIDDLSEASACLVIVDALVGALRSDDTIASVISVLQSLQKSLFMFTSLSEDPTAVARALRVISRIHILLRPYKEASESKIFAEDVLNQAKDHKILDVIGAAEKSGDMAVTLRGEEAFNLISTLCNEFVGMLELKEPAKDLFNRSAALLFRPDDQIRGRIADGAKRRRTDTSVDTVTARLENFTLNAAAMLTQFPGLLSLPPLESLESLLRLLYWYAFGEYAGQYQSPHKISYGVVFEAMSDIVLSLQSSDLKGLLFSIFFEGLHSETKLSKSKELRSQLCAFSESQYLRIPSAVMSRKHREQVIDRLCIMCCSGKKRPDDDTFFRHLSVMVKLMEMPNATSQLATDPDMIWGIARSTQDNGRFDPNLLKLLDDLVRLTLGGSIAVKDQTKGQQYLDGFKKTMRRFVKDAGTFQDIAGLTCFKTALVALKAADLLWDEEETYKTMKRYLRTLDNDLDKLLPGALSTLSDAEMAFLRAVLKAVADLPTNGLGRDGYLCSIESKLLQCIQTQQKSDTSISQSEASTWVSLAKALANVAGPDEAISVSNMIHDLWHCDLSANDRHDLLEASRNALGSLGVDRKASILSSFKFTSGDEHYLQTTLILMNILISSLPDVPSKEDVSSPGLNGFLGQLSTYLESVESMRDLHAALNCVDTILREKHWLVSQWAIESMIDSLSRLASSSGPELPPEHADSIYTRLCGTTHLIISLHRTRLGGRFHVLIPLLQNLLRCLFTPDARHGNSGAPSLPPWLSHRTKSLTTTNASNFARIVTTLCSPSVSSVRGHRPRKRAHNTELVDETKKAREYAGQYVSALIVQFCSCQLQGRIGPEMREALMPALYACADVVGIEALRAMNAGMDAGARAIWRGVYSDWKKFGRWEGR